MVAQYDEEIKIRPCCDFIPDAVEIDGGLEYKSRLHGKDTSSAHPKIEEP
jgi:hypothetical protein